MPEVPAETFWRAPLESRGASSTTLYTGRQVHGRSRRVRDERIDTLRGIIRPGRFCAAAFFMPAARGARGEGRQGAGASFPGIMDTELTHDRYIRIQNGWDCELVRKKVVMWFVVGMSVIVKVIVCWSSILFICNTVLLSSRNLGRIHFVSHISLFF